MTLSERINALSNRMGNHIRDNVTPRLLPTGGTVGQIATKNANGTVSFVDPFLKAGGTIGGNINISGGKIIAGTASGTGGSTVLEGLYDQSGTYGSLSVLGNNASSGGWVMGYGVRPKIGVNNAVISTSQLTLPRSAVMLDSDFRFFSGLTQSTAIGNDATLTEKFTILNSGFVGINNPSPQTALDVAGLVNSSGGYYLAGVNVAVTAGLNTNNINGRIISNGTGTGGAADGLYLGYLNSSNGGTHIYDGGRDNFFNVQAATVSTSGITKFLFGNQTDNGTFAQFSGAVHAKSNLTVDGTLSFGDLGTRTERTTNAGVASYSKSGFYDAFAATNFPVNDGSWWHLMNAMHYNSLAGNNYAMQIAGSFFDQKIYFRKTNTNAAQVWREFVTSDMAGNVLLNGLDITGTNTGINTNAAANKGTVTVGVASTTTSSFFVNTASLNSNYSSGLGVDGSYSAGTVSSTINLKAFGVQSGGGYGSNLAFWTGVNGTVSEKMRITENGAFGFGTTAPIGSFDVKLATNQHIQFVSNVNSADIGASGIVCINDANSAYTPLGFYASRYSFGNGSVGIGTNTPVSKLDVNGDINTSGVLNLSGSGFAFWDGTYQRIYKRNATPFLSISNNETYCDNNFHFFRTSAGVHLAQIDSDGVYTPYKFRGAKLMLGSSVDNGNALQVTGYANISSFLSLGENLGMNNGQYHYWKDNGGTYRRHVGLIGNNMLFGNIDNDLANSSNYFYANNAHLFVNNTIETARITQNGNFGLGTNSPQGIIDVVSTTKPSYPKPRMTTAQINAITGMSAGAEVFDITINRPKFYNGSTWIQL